jgi:hypothetical protein
VKKIVTITKDLRAYVKTSGSQIYELGLDEAMLLDHTSYLYVAQGDDKWQMERPHSFDWY